MAALAAHRAGAPAPAPVPAAGSATAPCVLGCPLGIDVPAMAAAVARGDLAAALGRVLDRTPFPSFCACLCRHPCQAACARGAGTRPVAIRHLVRLALDRADPPPAPAPRAPTGRRVAVVGGGPAGLAAAHVLATAGHRVTVLDQSDRPGGSAADLIPSFRLPDRLLRRDLDRVFATGVVMKPGFRLGRDFTLDDLAADGFDATLLAIGLDRPPAQHVPGDDAEGVIHGRDLLLQARGPTPPALQGPFVGIGCTGMVFDAARVALRLGASGATVVFPRPLGGMPLPDEDIRAAEREGVRTLYLAEPVRIARRGRRAHAVVVRKVAPGGATACTEAIGIPGDDIEIPARLVCLATAGPGQAPAGGLAGLAVGARGLPILDPETRMTSRPGVFAAGDLAGGPERIAEAVADGLRAGRAIDAWLRDAPAPATPSAARPAVHRSVPPDPLETAGVTWDGLDEPAVLAEGERLHRAADEARRCDDCPCRAGCAHP